MTQKMSRFIKKNWVILLGMVAVYLVDIWIIAQTKGMTTPRDEIGMFAVAAKLAGFDWGDVIQESAYYGFGYFGLFAPFFKYVEDPDIVHKIVLLTDSLVKILVIPIIYHIEIKFLHVEDRKFAGVVAIMLSVINVSLRAGRPYNEFPMHLLLWIDIWLLCKLIESYNNKAKKMKYSIMLEVALAFGLLLHTRFAALIYAFAITFVILFVLNRKCYINFYSLIIGFSLCIITNQFIEYVQNYIWGASGVELGNASIEISSMISFTNPKMYLLWFDILLGNIAMMIIQTGGIFTIATVSVVFFGIKNLIEKKIDEEEVAFWGIVLCTTLCMGATLLALLISNWYGGMTYSFFQEEYGNNVYSYKGMVYLRYWGIYITPFIMCGLVWIKKNNWWKKTCNISLIVNVVMVGLFLKMILPWIENNADCLTFIHALAGWKKGDVCNRESYILSCMVLIIVCCLTIKCFRSGRIKLMICVLSVFFVWQQVWSSIYFDIPITEEIYELVDASVEKLASKGEEDLPNRIIAPEFNKSRNASYKQSLSLQYYLREYKVYADFPGQLEEGDLIITRKKISKNILEEYFSDVSYEIEKIDEDEYWYYINRESGN